MGPVRARYREVLIELAEGGGPASRSAVPIAGKIFEAR